MDLTYPVQLTPAEEGGFVVSSPLLPIYTQGETEEEALHNAEEAVLCHLDGLAKHHNAMPHVRMSMIHVRVPDTLQQ